MTDEQKHLIRLLSRVTFLPATFDKRFAKSLIGQLEKRPDLVFPAPEKPLSDKQDALLRQIVHKYRRQHRQCPCEECKK